MLTKEPIKVLELFNRLDKRLMKLVEQEAIDLAFKTTCSKETRHSSASHPSHQIVSLLM